MNKGFIIALLSIGINIALLFYCLHQPCAEVRETSLTQPTHERSGTTFNVAIFEPAPHPAIDEITRGFKQTLETQGTHPYAYTVYNANANKTLQRAQGEEIVQKNYDLIFTIGAGCTQVIKELMTKKNLTTPVVFSAVDDPVGMGIIASLHNSQNHLTGIIEHPDYQRQIAILTTLKPQTRSILLVYDPTHGTGLEKDKEQLAQIAAEYDIILNAVPIYNAGELQQKVEPMLQKNDVVLVLKDSTIVSAIDSLIRLCNRYGKTLYASDLNSGHKGAALAYGVHEQEFGTESAKKVLAILEQNQTPATIPTTALRDYNVTINRTTATKQQLHLQPTLELLLKSSKFIDINIQQGESA